MKFEAIVPRAHRSSVAGLSLAFVLLSPSIGFSQVADTTPPPPAHLPRLIDECEGGPNYYACSVWIWHGSSYSAIWSNGAVGQLTVASGGGRDLHIERLNSPGPMAGLTASYTGQWDGKSFSAEKMTATWKGTTSSLVWTATPAVTPVLKSTQFDYSYVSRYTAQLTAYAIYANQGSFNASVGTEINDYRIRGERPMNPGETRRFDDRYRAIPASCAKGVSYPQASVVAAIYADGTTFGDARVLRAMLDRRESLLAGLTRFGTKLCRLGQQGASVRGNPVIPPVSPLTCNLQ